MKCDTNDPKTIAMAVAQHFMILSAYFITAAITSPPTAAIHIIRTASELIPCIQPFSLIDLASLKPTLTKEKIIPKKP